MRFLILCFALIAVAVALTGCAAGGCTPPDIVARFPLAFQHSVSEPVRHVVVEQRAAWAAPQMPASYCAPAAAAPVCAPPAAYNPCAPYGYAPPPPAQP